MPPLEVSAALQTTPWRYASVSGVEVLSSCADSTTRAFIHRERRLEQLFAVLVPEEFQVKLAVPKIIVLSDQKRTLSASQDILVGFGKGDGRKSAAAKVPAALQRPRASAVRFMPNLRLNDPDVVTVFAMIDESRFNASQVGLSAEHVRFVLEQRAPPLPAWLIEGFTRLGATTQFGNMTILIPAAEWVGRDETEKLKSDPDFPRKLLPMRGLFEERRPPRTGDTADLSNRWAAQCELFARWMLEGDESRWQAFWKFVTRASAGPVNEAIFQECFALSYADARDMLSDYLVRAIKEPIRIQPRNLVQLPDFKLRLATDAEIGRLKGDWERLEIGFVRAHFPEYTVRYEEQAARTLAKSYAADARDPRLLAVLGLHACDLGRDDEARPLLEAAVAARVVRPRAYFELARLRYMQAIASPAGEDGALSATQVNAVLEPLRVAHGQLPPLAQTYALTAEVWSRGGVRLARQHFDLLDEGLRLFPTQLPMIYQIAVLKAQQGAGAEAAALIERGLRLSPTAAGKAAFEKLQTMLVAPAK